jgi:putative sigma-54 modulation protein
VQITISTRHGQLSSGAREKITEKVGKLLRFNERLTAVNVTVDLEHQDEPLVEIKISAEHTEDFIAADRSSSVLAALDLAMHKVEQQLRKHKEKWKDHRVPGFKHQEMPPEA